MRHFCILLCQLCSHEQLPLTTGLKAFEAFPPPYIPQTLNCQEKRREEKRRRREEKRREEKRREEKRAIACLLPWRCLRSDAVCSTRNGTFVSGKLSKGSGSHS